MRLGETRWRGIYLRGPNPHKVEYCLIAGNISFDKGGGIFCNEHGHYEITNCTITQNQSVTGGGIYIEPPTLATISDSIVWNNTGGDIGGVINEGDKIFYTNYPGAAICNCPPNLAPHNCNLNNDPQFIDPNGVITPLDPADDFTLAAGSPCIDHRPADAYSGNPDEYHVDPPPPPYYDDSWDPDTLSFNCGGQGDPLRVFDVSPAERAGRRGDIGRYGGPGACF